MRQVLFVKRYDVSDGLHIRWRETAPDRGLLAFALKQIDALHGAWPETLQCNIVIERERAPSAAKAEPRFRAQVELDLGHRSPRVKAHALNADLYAAIRQAFCDVRLSMPAYAALNEPYAYELDEVAA
ncbi:MAG: hypothetical protein JWN04_4835 [Myxococcaceae bacterium]|nr:hypothetical protein [Myxococcaceae bacterium]